MGPSACRHARHGAGRSGNPLTSSLADEYLDEPEAPPTRAVPRGGWQVDATTFIDYYELLQVSPNADEDTIQRVFRHLAK